MDSNSVHRKNQWTNLPYFPSKHLPLCRKKASEYQFPCQSGCGCRHPHRVHCSLHTDYFFLIFLPLRLHFRNEVSGQYQQLQALSGNSCCRERPDTTGICSSHSFFLTVHMPLHHPPSLPMLFLHVLQNCPYQAFQHNLRYRKPACHEDRSVPDNRGAFCPPRLCDHNRNAYCPR